MGWTYLHAESSYYHFHEVNLIIQPAYTMPPGRWSHQCELDVFYSHTTMAGCIHRLYIMLGTIVKYRPYIWIHLKKYYNWNKNSSTLKINDKSSIGKIIWQPSIVTHTNGWNKDLGIAKHTMLLLRYLTPIHMDPILDSCSHGSHGLGVYTRGRS
jgi:hypothetical protein